MALGHSIDVRRLLSVLGLAVCAAAPAVLGQPAPSFGAADRFVILAGRRVVNSGPTMVVGNVGVSTPTPDPPPVVPLLGSFVSGNSVARAQQQNKTLYDDLAGRRCDEHLDVFPPVLLRNRVYCISSEAPLHGPVTLSGKADDVWIVQVTGSLTVDADATIVLQDGAQSSHVFWTVSESATLGPGSAFAGNILARDDITFGHGVTFAGRALAQLGTVTLDSDAINLCGSLVVLSPLKLPPGAVGVEYLATTISADGGKSPYTLGLPENRDDPFGIVPPGMTFNVATGLVSGKPLKEGSFHFGVTVEDAEGALGVRYYSIDVCPAVTPPPPPLPTAYVCETYRGPLTGGGGCGRYKFDVTGLPPGLLPPTPDDAAITGIPCLKGSFPIGVTVTDTISGSHASAEYTLIVECRLMISASLPNGKVCEDYGGTLTPSCPSTICPGKFTVEINEALLPPGLSLDPKTGVITGKPQEAGMYPFTAQIKTDSDCLASAKLVIEISPPDPPTVIHRDATICVPFNERIEGVIKGTLPPDLVFKDKMLQGTPKVTDLFPLTVKYDDPAHCPREQVYEINVTCPNTILAEGLPHVFPFYHWFDFDISRPEFDGCFIYSVDQATLPHGLAPVGNRIMGKPDTLSEPGHPSQILVTATATTADGKTTTVCKETYELEIVDPPLCEAAIILSPPPMKLVPPGKVGVPYPPRKFQASGGVAPYAYAVGGDTLPPGLKLSNAKGVLSGTPTMAGRFTFPVWATDSTGTNGCPQIYSIDIDGN